jgi:hypothetical protein
MSFSAEEILAAWDGLAADFEFAGFNNMNYDTADARLHLFRDDSRWALVIEETVDWPAADGLMTLSFVSGTGLKGSPGLGATLYAVEADFDEDEDEEPVLPSEVTVRGNTVKVPADSIIAQAEEDDVSEAFGLLVWLLGQHRSELFRSSEELEALVDGLPHILQLDDWCHPDVYLDGKVSSSETFQQLADVLATGDTDKYKGTETPNNRDWKKWLEDK